MTGTRKRELGLILVVMIGLVMAAVWKFAATLKGK